jgi:hypothetical protein
VEFAVDSGYDVKGVLCQTRVNSLPRDHFCCSFTWKKSKSRANQVVNNLRTALILTQPANLQLELKILHDIHLYKNITFQSGCINLSHEALLQRSKSSRH